MACQFQRISSAFVNSKYYRVDISAKSGLRAIGRGCKVHKKKAKLGLMITWSMFRFGDKKAAAPHTFISRRLASGFGAGETPARTAELLSGDAQWTRATAAMSSAISTFVQVTELQSGAAGHLDAADYALQHLRQELGGVLPVAASELVVVPGAVPTATDAEPLGETLAA